VPLLAAAICHAVFPGGARIRPKLCLAVANACGDDDPTLSDAAASAIELLHCASLVHDDLPCFDDAPVRRGQASVHWAFGEPLAVLAGDALIVLAFQTLAEAAPKAPAATGSRLLGTLARASACRMASWPGRPGSVNPRCRCATTSGPRPAPCSSPPPWPAPRPRARRGPLARLGACLGEAYQVADDIRDVVADPAVAGQAGRPRPGAGPAELGQRLGAWRASAHASTA
jgi:geranylgeranyl diphosphate synthase type II